MNFLGFLSSLIDSLAWPTVVIILILKFKEPISKVINSLAHMKYKDFELEFRKELEQIEEKGGINTNEIKRKISESNYEAEIETVAEISPMAAIPLAWSHVERELLSTIQRLSISPDYPAYNSPLKNINLLKESSLLDEKDYFTLNKIRMLRNDVAHQKLTSNSITSETAIEYARIAFQMITKLKSINKALTKK